MRDTIPSLNLAKRKFPLSVENLIATRPVKLRSHGHPNCNWTDCRMTPVRPARRNIYIRLSVGKGHLTGLASDSFPHFDQLSLVREMKPIILSTGASKIDPIQF